MAPWEDIYATDDERRMSFADVLVFHEAIVEACEVAGYRLIEVPRDSIEQREAFVRSFVTRGRRTRVQRVSRKRSSDLAP
jgi:predicted ATPase